MTLATLQEYLRTMASAHGEPSTSLEEFNHDVEEMAIDLESDDDDDIQPNTHRKYQGAAVYYSRYDRSWKTRYPCIQAIKRRYLASTWYAGKESPKGI